ncbi:unnamed protein product [Adineta steineri]|uniref:Ubiquitin carboxyl-terminal hydrolase n=1 Tax=Adineta steineri TaxID=433720 RepID=A0A813PEY6_9BILA|nr:unnamed protein product [Adineta steineri]
MNRTPPNTYNRSQSAAYFSSEIQYIPLKICQAKHSRSTYTILYILPSETIENLKKKIAYHLRLDLPVNKFHLEIFDEIGYQWQTIDDSNPFITIGQLKLPSNSILNIEYANQIISIDQRSLHSTATPSNNHELLLQLCKKPMDRTEYRFLTISSFSTLSKLRKQAYQCFNKLSTNKPIYAFINDNWTKFNTDMDDIILHDLQFPSNVFISTEPDNDDESYSKVPRGLCGIENLGSTCFMNSVFQCLSNVPEFTKKVLEFTDEVNAPIINEYRKLMEKIWSGKYKSIAPSLLLAHIKDNLPRYDSYRQQDAQEFMSHFLNLIHAEFSTRETFITDLFYGQIQSTVKCLKCNHTEITNESISFIPLPISNYNQKTILYVKVDGEYRRVSILINTSVINISNLIDCFLIQHEPTLIAEEILPIKLVNNNFKESYNIRKSLNEIREEEFAFLQCPKKTLNEKYILCEFFDFSINGSFRPPTVLVCPTENCSYIHLSDQIDQILGHLCSVTNAPISACQLYWIDSYDKRYKLKTNEKLPYLTRITIEMSAEWIDIYKVYNNINYSRDNSALTSLLAAFFHEEPLDDDYHCLICSKLTKARQKSSLCLPLPQILIIQLKRFTYDIHSNDKIDTHISFPLYELDLKEYLVKNTNNQHENDLSTKYNLVSVSNHTGSLISGHYTTYAKNVQDGNWYQFDDKVVKKLNNDNDIVTKNAYLLVYVRTT